MAIPGLILYEILSKYFKVPKLNNKLAFFISLMYVITIPVAFFYISSKLLSIKQHREFIEWKNSREYKLK